MYEKLTLASELDDIAEATAEVLELTASGVAILLTDETVEVVETEICEEAAGEGVTTVDSVVPSADMEAVGLEAPGLLIAAFS
jgi:hypothetical protein